ncbi:nucleoid occlusion protein [Salisediminibacterium selenitireducens]|uniref:ParB-like partition protein n=1 Tax=Bacillus selenitireducens (strain ATCC 700615 / DSM 15326 / MLS10) TaxID=439292 RepID=D6Y1L3_BACIE|nr:nucleoid occlusion protein [Salisediminibacterium selenitireducens]ADI00800.1 parB-like partition protein [[Bacillus] selenitireducens MLS10]
MKQSFSKWLGLDDQQQDSDEEKVEDALIDEREEVERIQVNDIVPNPFQPRTVFNEDKIEELAETLHTHGMIQPIIVRKRDDHYEIIAGERRWRAVQTLGWETVPAVVKEMNDTKTASVALIENLQREELTSIEEAAAYQKLLELHGLTQESLAQRLGKGQSTVANKLRLLQLSGEVQEALKQRKITERHARALLSVKEETAQVKILVSVIEKEWNVKQTEEAVKKALHKPEKKKRPKVKSVSKDTRLAMNTIRQSVDMVSQTGLSIDTDEEEHDDYYQFTIRIPKK